MSYTDEIKPGTTNQYTILGKRNIISQKDNMTKEINLLTFNDSEEPKIDLRVWKRDGNKEQVQTGITFTIPEIIKLKGLLNKYDNIIDLFADIEK